ncbi:type II restriction/modification system DNA methylase subunit YeeA [Methanocalculus sp. AMF5]|uniref:BREX-1 system adenine-specific DNA-methyltransferase PglX n=1 Tax=Methanocalculus sp. AMF5 TaxID=1198257 RepID=UPI0020A222C7|nr:BREX-1 system adenine-specific DNA-methyltransferase PglX [Methanocalculus sp. AMF5]MCP1663283.1 type II restriction/modification system DNA methylase subunit YeeA [Methanocalculus sp. AMF5]
MTRDTKTNNPVPNFYRASAADFKKIPGSPIAYWVSERERQIFKEGFQLGVIAPVKQGLATADNDRFLRLWFEVNYNKIGYNINSHEEALDSKKKWFPYNKGGDFRKWYGNQEYLINWERNGAEINSFKPRSVVRNPNYYFKESITWSFVSSSFFGVRYSDCNAIFDVGGSSAFPNKDDIYCVTGLLCSKQSFNFMKIMNPTLNFQVGNVANIPFLYEKINTHRDIIDHIVKKIIILARCDWDSYETSWDFETLPLLRPEFKSPTLEESYKKLRSHWREMTLEMQRLEEENNRIFIEAYGLQDELTPDVPLKEITLTCNPHYRYGGNKTEAELEALLLKDTIKEFISYAVGCMFGRYSPDMPGLILANQGDGIKEFHAKVPDPSFIPDDDNIIPILDDEYFSDDIVSRFKEFLKVVFGRETLSKNLEYIARILSGTSTGSPESVLRNYFIRDFYKDHVQRYKKRPIYWMFSSGKSQGFNALIYMHRYTNQTLAKMRTDYLLELESKLDAEVSMLSGDAAKNKTRITTIRSQIEEITKYDELLNNKALSMIGIDLDDGVSVNYTKFEGLVKEI